MTMYVGDVHGKFPSFNEVLKEAWKWDEEVVQVGDFGLGFKCGEDSDKHWLNVFDTGKSKSSYHFIRGNHDNPDYVAKCPNYIIDGHYRNGIMYVGGAYSIDKAYRKQGVDWWVDEEVSQEDLEVIYAKYAELKPRRLVTHTCPWSIAHSLFGNVVPRLGTVGPRTENMFDQMFYIHQPEEWVFGHWHYSRDRLINNTRFICLNELETIILED